MDGNARTTMLLTVSLGPADRVEERPLSGTEWHRLAAGLRDRGIEPGALLKGLPEDLLPGWADPSVTSPRLSGLLGRENALGTALDRWADSGLWVMASCDEDYPQRLEARLKARRPPILFGCGPRGLPGKGGVAIVGSRDADESALSFAQRLGGIAAQEGRVVVSGGARGVDRRAMQGALKSGGEVVGVLGDGLLRAATSPSNRDHILSGSLTLVSPYNPEARFTAGRAMGRNSLIYCLADAAVVVSSAYGKGGTWSGAMQCLRGGWVPVWVRDGASVGQGNAELLKKGARSLPEDVGSLTGLESAVPQGRMELV